MFKNSTITQVGQITVVSIIFGVLFDYFFFEKMPGISFPLYIILIVVGFFVLVRFSRKQKQIKKESFLLFIPLLFFSGMVFVRSSELLTFLNIVASLLLLLIIAELSFGAGVKQFVIADYIKIFFFPLQLARAVFQTVSRVLSLGTGDTNKTVVVQVVKGIFITIPVLCILLLLFSSADFIFQQYLSSLIAVDIDPETGVRAALIVIVTLFFIGAYAHTLRDREDHMPAQNTTQQYTIGRIESSILFSAVNTLFFIFILVQLTYLFGGESTIAAHGFTYAEYARRGFFELIAVAVISLLLLLVTEKYVIKKDADHSFGFKAFSTALVIQVLVIMASASMRLSLYEEAYGFTTVRFYSHASIILLAVVFCLLWYKIYTGMRECVFAFRVFISVGVFLIVMNVLNPDAYIARRHIERFAATGTLDLYYLSRLSGDAMPEIIRVLEISQEDLKKEFAHELYWRPQQGSLSYFSKWPSLNLSRSRADNIFHAHIQEIEPYK